MENTDNNNQSTTTERESEQTSPSGPDPNWVTPSDKILSGSDSAEFGTYLDLSEDGKTAIIGSYEAVSGSAVHIFSQSDGNWIRESELSPDDHDGDFVAPVAISGDGTTAIAGQYVFSKTGESWRQQSVLKPEDEVGANDGYGSSVELSADGSTALIGAQTQGDWRGSAYVFSQEGGEWTQQAKLSSRDSDSDDRFGVGLALSRDGTVALVGAAFDEDPNGENEGKRSGAGSAYVFSESNGKWTQQSKLAADNGSPNDSFGTSVSLSGDGTVALIGATRSENRDEAGSAYIFSTTGGTWSQQTEITAENAYERDDFGISVSLSEGGETALIGARYGKVSLGSDEARSGSGYIFTRSDETWTQQTQLAASLERVNEPLSLGSSSSFSMEGNTVMLGAPRSKESGTTNAGSVFVYDISQQS